jgi:adenylate cyclase
VGRAAAEEILARDPGLGGREQLITVMFVDIRSFTARAATAPAPQTVRELNEFLRIAVEVVESRHGGMINKFLGDGFMALFGVGGDHSDHADRAVSAGRDMLQALETLNEQLLEQGGKAFRIGIGLHTGTAIVGSIGSPERLEFTAIGSTVNLASRIEELTKQTAESLLLTRATAERLSDGKRLIEIPIKYVRGMDEPVTVFAMPPHSPGGEQ